MAEIGARKHICFYIGSLQRGGAERMIVGLAEYFFSRGHKVTLVTTYLAEDEYEVPHAAWKHLGDERLPEGTRAVQVMYPDERLTYISITGNLKAGEEGIRRVFSGLLPKDQVMSRAANVTMRTKILHDFWERLKPDLIVSFIGKNNIMALLSSVGTGIPVAVSVRSNPSREYAQHQLKFTMLSTYRRAAGVILQTQESLKFFPPNIQERCTILPNAISEEFIRPYDEDRTFKKEIVAVGALDKNKNHALLLKAFARIAPKHPNHKVVIYGEGIEKKRLQAIAQQLEIQKQVKFAGQVPNVADRIQNACCFVLCSNEEGMPNALMEAMALGIPSISTDCPCGGPKELIHDGVTGLLIHVGDVAQLERALIRFVDNEGFAKMLAKKGHKNIHDRFSPQVVYPKWEEYLLGLIDGEGAEEDAF